LDKILNQTATDLLAAAEVNIQLGFMDRAPLADYCSAILRSCLQTRGVALILLDDPNSHEHGLMALSIEHLTPRLWLAVNTINLKGILNADRSVFMPEDIYMVLQYRIRDWCISDQHHIEAAIELILGRKPWSSWPVDDGRV